MVFYLVLCFTIINLTILMVLLVKFAGKKVKYVDIINPKMESAKKRELSLFLDGECKKKKG